MSGIDQHTPTTEVVPPTMEANDLSFKLYSELGRLKGRVDQFIDVFTAVGFMESTSYFAAHVVYNEPYAPSHWLRDLISNKIMPFRQFIVPNPPAPTSHKVLKAELQKFLAALEPEQQRLTAYRDRDTQIPLIDSLQKAISDAEISHKMRDGDAIDILPNQRKEALNKLSLITESLAVVHEVAQELNKSLGARATQPCEMNLRDRQSL